MEKPIALTEFEQDLESRNYDVSKLRELDTTGYEPSEYLTQLFMIILEQNTNDYTWNYNINNKAYNHFVANGNVQIIYSDNLASGAIHVSTTPITTDILNGQKLGQATDVYNTEKHFSILIEIPNSDMLNHTTTMGTFSKYVSLLLDKMKETLDKRWAAEFYTRVANEATVVELEADNDRDFAKALDKFMKGYNTISNKHVGVGNDPHIPGVITDAKGNVVQPRRTFPLSNFSLSYTDDYAIDRAYEVDANAFNDKMITEKFRVVDSWNFTQELETALESELVGTDETTLFNSADVIYDNIREARAMAFYQDGNNASLHGILHFQEMEVEPSRLMRSVHRQFVKYDSFKNKEYPLLIFKMVPVSTPVGAPTKSSKGTKSEE